MTAQLKDAGEWIERRELEVSQSPAHPHRGRCHYCENLTLEPFDQSISPSYTTQHNNQNGDHHRGEARWYVSAQSQAPTDEHVTDSPE